MMNHEVQSKTICDSLRNEKKISLDHHKYIQIFTKISLFRAIS